MATDIDTVAYQMAFELGDTHTQADNELNELATEVTQSETRTSPRDFAKQVWEHYTKTLDYQLVYDMTIEFLKADKETLEMYGFDQKGLEVWMKETAYDIYDEYARYVHDMYDVPLPTNRSPHHDVASGGTQLNATKMRAFMNKQESKKLAEKYPPS